LGTSDGAVQDSFRRHVEERDDEAPRKGAAGPKYRSYTLSPTEPKLVAAGAAIAERLVFAADVAAAWDDFVDHTHAQRVTRERWAQLDKFWTAPERFARHLNRA